MVWQVHRGAYHPMVASGAYYVNGLLSSTYLAYVPFPIWKVFGDGYITLRYKLGSAHSHQRTR